jgi:hypothetical protein
MTTGGQVAGNSGQHTVLSPDPAQGQSGARERLDRPAASHLQPAELVHAHVYAAIFADGIREWSRGSTDVLAQRANMTASLAVKFYQPWVGAS